MSRHKSAPFVAPLTLVERRFPDLDDPPALIDAGLVWVNGLPATNPRTRVRADSSVQVRHPRPLRGTIKLAHALNTFRIDVVDVVARDLGAAAGGFTQALLDAGAARVYAVADAIGQIDRQLLAPAAQLVALIKPTFELHTGTLADSPEQVHAAVASAARALAGYGWNVLDQQPSPIRGSKGAIEVLLHAELL